MVPINRSVQMQETERTANLSGRVNFWEFVKKMFTRLPMSFPFFLGFDPISLGQTKARRVRLEEWGERVCETWKLAGKRQEDEK